MLKDKPAIQHYVHIHIMMTMLSYLRNLGLPLVGLRLFHFAVNNIRRQMLHVHSPVEVVDGGAHGGSMGRAWCSDVGQALVGLH